MENEYIIINEEGIVSKYNLDEKEILNIVDNNYPVLRVNNGKIEYANSIHPNREINNVI